jgi:2-amino-4-hydroxy-6-hydroxymethyldihydropteridine diphosphokinase
MNRWQPAYVGIGSNIGDSVAAVRAAIAALDCVKTTRLISTSPLYRTRPFGPVPQANFINAVAGVLTQLTPQQLLAELLALEAAQGRQRNERWGPRSLDLDLLVFGALRMQTPELTLPHPGIAERGFVLVPLADIAPTLEIPALGSVTSLLHSLSDTGIEGVLDA